MESKNFRDVVFDNQKEPEASSSIYQRNHGYTPILFYNWALYQNPWSLPATRWPTAKDSLAQICGSFTSVSHQLRRAPRNLKMQAVDLVAPVSIATRTFRLMAASRFGPIPLHYWLTWAPPPFLPQNSCTFRLWLPRPPLPPNRPRL